MFNLKKPCNDCPFRKEHGIRLTKGRTKEIAGCFITEPGAIFPCHKTTDKRKRDRDICAGGLMFAEKQGICVNTYRIGERLGLYKVNQLDKASFGEVFDSLKDMLKLAD